MTPSEIEHELQALRDEVAKLKQQPRARATRMPMSAKISLGAALIACMLVSVSGVFAAGGNCPNGLPVCFVAGLPAKAADINQDLAQLKEWIEAKVGTVAAGGVSTASVTMTSATTTNLTTTNETVSNLLTLNGSQAIVGGNTSGNLHIDSRKTGADGRIYLNWFDGKGVVLGNGSGSAIMSTDTTTISVTNTMVIAGRHFPETIKRKDCASASCTESCPAGYVIKMAIGIHGATNGITSGDWACGQAAGWMGGCFGATSCTVNTGCGSSAMYLECW